jgi:hypothetical protein
MPLESPHGRCRLSCLQVISCIQTHSCRPFGALRARLSKHESLSIMGGLLRQVYGVSSVQRPGRMICMKRLEGGASCRSRRFKSVSPFSPASRSSSITGCSDRLAAGEPHGLKGDTPPGADSSRKISMPDHAVRRDSRAADGGEAGRGRPGGRPRHALAMLWADYLSREHGGSGIEAGTHGHVRGRCGPSPWP